MLTYDEEMTVTCNMYCTCERISPEDLAVAESVLNLYFKDYNCRTYDFHITSDMLTDSEETLK